MKYLTPVSESVFMVDIVDATVANGFDSGYDESRAVPNFERMIGFALHSDFDWKGTRP
jgi:hypothetical protein